jgi:polyisoprenoid-binding protein YceI
LASAGKFFAREVVMDRPRSIQLFTRSALLFAATLCIPSLAPILFAQESVVTLDPAQTKIEFTLPATGHTVHGAFKLKSGEIHFDTTTGKASGALIVDATSGESGSDGRDKKMHQEIIESPKFSEISFMPHTLKQSVASEGTSEGLVGGTFRLRGQEHEITLRFTAEHLAGNQVKIETHFSVPYVEWGLKNPSSFILRVDKAVGVEIHAVGQFATPKAAP